MVVHQNTPFCTGFALQTSVNTMAHLLSVHIKSNASVRRRGMDDGANAWRVGGWLIKVLNVSYFQFSIEHS
jgi:hypothetical protein